MAIESPITKEANWFAGEEKTLRLVIYEEDGETVQNISGYTLQWVLAKNKYAVPTLTKNMGADGITIPTGSDGVVTIKIDRDDTKDLKGGTYFHTLWRIDAEQETVLTFGPAVLRKAARFP